MTSWPTGASSPPRSLHSAVRLILLRCIGRTYPRGKQTQTLRSLLLIRPDHLGDLLFLTPALHALRSALPNTRVTLMVGPWAKPVVETNPDIDEILVCSFPGFERAGHRGLISPYRQLFSLARSIRARHFDAVVVLRFDHWWGAWLAAAAGVPRRLGYDRPETRPFLTSALPYRENGHEVLQNATLLETLAPGAVQSPGPTRFNVTKEDRVWAEGWLRTHPITPERPLVVIHPGSGSPFKQWPITAWAAVGDALADDPGVNLLLTGGASEKTLCHELAARMSAAPHDLAGQTTLGQLAALYARSTLVLGSDSGPLHLAVAMGTRSVHLHGPVSALKFGPWGDPQRHAVLTAHWPCVPCNRLDWDIEELPSHGCMASITPDDVLTAALEQLNAAREDPRTDWQGA